MSGAYNDDEALAKALQEEYDREYRRRSRANRTSLGNSQLGQPESGTSLGSVPYSEVSSRPASSRASSTRSLSRSYHRKTASAVPLSSAADSSAPSSRRIMSDHGVSGNSFPEHDSDVDFARRLERAFREEERSIRTSGAPASNGYTLPPPVNPAVQPYLLDESFPDDETMGRRKAKADEELARRLQQAMLSQSAPVAVTSSNAAALNISPHSGDFLTGISSQANGPATLSSIEVSDAEFARRLQREISSEEAQRSSAPRTAPSRDSVKRARTARTSSSLSESDVSALSMISAMTDEEVAMKLQQELRDEEIARRLSRQEQTRSSQRRRAQQPRCTARAFFTIVVPLVLVGAAAAGIVWYFTKGNAGSFFPSPEDFRQEDPFSAQNSTTADRWRSKGQGLSLEVISALQDKWYPFFQVALSQWDNGAPDALTLTTSNSSYDYDCSPVNFKLKVCNGDYGNTRWRGINKILLSDGFIFASSARMNEYYFPSGTSSDQRQYTMWYEVRVVRACWIEGLFSSVLTFVSFS